MTRDRPSKLGLAVGGVVGAIGVVAVAASFDVVSRVPQHVPPWAAPLAVGLLLIGLGLALAFQAATGRRRPDSAPTDKAGAGDETPGGSAAPLAWLGAGVLANALLIGPLGFIPASAVLFAAAASAFGSRRLLLNLAVGLAMATALEFVFVALLGLELGRGAFSLPH